MNRHTSVIAAVSTPPGKGGVAIIRISGEGAVNVAERAFKPRSGKPLSDCPPRAQIYGHIYYKDEEIDDGLATVFPAPHSYTGEETVEISCHGGMLITATVLEAVLYAGAAPAAPGEFTRRAFTNGRLTLTEAEAIGSLLEAESHAKIKLSRESSRRKLTEKTEEIRRSLVDLMSSMYARIDYPDEDLGDFSDAEIAERLESSLEGMKMLASTYKTGHAVNEGIKTVIVGKPNVGKSTLFNLLLGRDAAIVTDIKGTTRDILTERIALGNVLISLSDTAGIRLDGDIDAVEKIGISRSKKKLSEADLILLMLDGSEELSCEDGELIALAKSASAEKLVIINKSECGRCCISKELLPFGEILEISAKKFPEDAKDAVTASVEKLFTDERISIGEDAIISTARQNASLMRAINLTRDALCSIRAGYSADLVSSDIERALCELSDLSGREVTDEIVADIFSKFCVGK